MNANLLLYLNPEVEHTYDTCGQCCQDLIREQIAREYLEQNRQISILDFHEETKRRWQRTPLYIEVQSLLVSGKSLEDVSDELEKKGILI